MKVDGKRWLRLKSAICSLQGSIGGAVNQMQQNQPQNQNQQQWFNKHQQIAQQQQLQTQQQQPIILARQMQGMGNFAGPGYMARPRQPQMGGVMNQGGYQGVFNAEQQQQQGMKPNQQQQQNSGNAGNVLTSQLQGGLQGHQVVMGPPGSQHAALQQQMMQNVRSPPPIASPQSTQSPRPAPSPRALPSPHHLPSHSPAPGGDLHNHLGHPHQSPLPAGGPMGDNVMGESPMNAQEQLSKFVEKL